MFNRFSMFVKAGVAVIGLLCTADDGLRAQDETLLQSPAPIAENVKPVRRPSDVFGYHLFGGDFANQNFVGFNPDYQIAVGDKITLTFWGGLDIVHEIIVDAQGNIFLPSVGPLRVIGVKNSDLNSVVLDAVKQVYKKNVGVYASLNGAEPAKVYVTGFVLKPGLFGGHSSNSILYFLDKAGGIDPERGSFLDIKVIRNGEVFQSVNLYDFVLSGRIPSFQIRDGDTIVVTPIANQVGVVGDVINPYRFEFSRNVTVSEVLELARPKPSATHVRIDRNSRGKNEVEYIALDKAGDILLEPGDRLGISSDKIPGTISVRVEGEHQSVREFVLPYGSSLQDLLDQVKFGENAEKESIQLLRESLKVRQKELLEAKFRAMEASVLTAQSRTASEAQLRSIEADLVLKFLERAADVEPRGQVTLAGARSLDDILLEPRDVIRIPRRSNLILVHGEVLFPNAIPFQTSLSVEEYIAQSGGFTQTAKSSNILVLHRDGTFIKLKYSQLDDRDLGIRPGDEIFVLPRVQSKSFQLAKDIIEVFYQLALSAGVVLRL